MKHQFARTTLKQMCVSVVCVKKWNSLQNDLKNICMFKKMYKENVIRQYEVDCVLVLCSSICKQL